jgi:hypothetical protein
VKAHPRVLTGLIVLATAVLAAVAATVATAAGPSINAAPQAGTVWERGLQNAAGHAKHTTSPNLIYHGGPVMHGTTQVYPIFWGTSWSSSAGDKITGLQRFYGAVGGSTYAGTNTEYTDGSGKVSPAVALQSTKIDPTAAISRAPQTSDILAEVARMYPTPTANAYYPVYVDQPRGHAQYCAWHSSGSINGVTVQFGFFFKLDGDSGCDPGATGTGHSQGLDALANVSGHELSEMLTDPQLNAWYDSQGAENSDKCAWTFGSEPLKLGGDSWRIQGNWSNNAYNSNGGYTDVESGGKVRGCIDGTNA